MVFRYSETQKETGGGRMYDLEALEKKVSLLGEMVERQSEMIESLTNMVSITEKRITILESNFGLFSDYMKNVLKDAEIEATDNVRELKITDQ